MSRDEELDRLEEELSKDTPFVQRPPALDIGNGTLCWLDGTRRCGADCVAFNAEELDDNGVPTDAPNKCLVLLYAGQQGAAAVAVLRSKPPVQAPHQGIPPPNPFGEKR